MRDLCTILLHVPFPCSKVQMLWVWTAISDPAMSFLSRPILSLFACLILKEKKEEREEGRKEFKGRKSKGE